jgi:hypothetical protein
MKRFLRVICAFLAVGLVACDGPEVVPTPDTTIKSLGTPADNEIWFTTIDGRDLMALNEEAFNTQITDIEYSEFEVNIIRFAEPLTTIGEGAFDNCRNINNISLPEGVTTIGERAFFECIQLECISFGSKIKECGFQAFDGCNAIYSIHVASVGYWCGIEFANPTANPIYHSGSFLINGKKVNELAIPSWVEHIGKYAFYNCSLLTSVKIPASIKSIGEDAFYGCENISKVDVESVGAWCRIDFVSAFSNPISNAGALYEKGQEATILSLEGVEAISKRAFQGCNNIRAFIADSELKTIGEEAFRGCAKLISVELQDGIQAIDGKAFMGCSALEHVAIKATAPPTLADKYVFDYNAEGRKIYIPAGAYNAYVSDPMWSKYADSLEGI